MPPKAKDSLFKPAGIAEQIFAHYAAKREPRRGYLGASNLGEECWRKLWLEFRWVMPPERHEGRMVRLFATGDIEEERLIADLEAIGHTVTDRQKESVLFGGHFACHIDGILDGERILELKTHSERHFMELKKKRVHKAEPKHYTQAQMAMGGEGLTETLYLAKGKNDDDLHDEVIPFDSIHYEDSYHKAENIIFAEKPPARIAETGDHPPCSWCHLRTKCFESRLKPVKPETNCRTCLHSTPEHDGTWSCAKHGTKRSREEQEAACGEHLWIPDLLPFGKPVAVSPSFIAYADRWVNRKGGHLEKLTRGDD